ncbi:MAG: tetratricopeptide repeat protein [Anaerolineae bacterium]|nr:tetratricopeptide repeat protein [Anaerolineae bacterium]
MTDVNTLLERLRRSLQILEQRQAKLGINAPPELILEIEDHRMAITLTEQLAAGRLTKTAWREQLKPLLVKIDDLLAPARDKNLTTLLSNVRKIWVEDYLHSALLNAIYLDLGLEMKQDAVPQPFEELNIRLRQPEQAEQDLPPGTRAIDVYRQAQGSLLILGQPGAGKTTTLATLAGDLVAEAENDASAPVPVLFNLSSWAAEQKPLGEWLAEELNRQYQVSRKLAKRWLAEGELALLLDGLDEVAEEQREACVAAINTYRKDEYAGPMVVCSRLNDYEALEARLKLGQAIVLKKLTQEQFEQYFERLQTERSQNHEQLMDLGKRIWQDEALRELVETPLMLNIITVTYATPEAPPLPEGQGDALRTEVFGAYSERMFERVGRTKIKLLYSKETSLRYLSYLATQVQAESLAQFSIGQIWSSWLPAGPVRRQYQWLSGLSSGLIFGPSCGLVVALYYSLFVGSSGRLFPGLIFGLIFGLLAGLGVGLNDMKPAENLYWVWRPALKASVGGAVGGLLGGAVSLITEVGIILPAWLIFGLIFGLGSGLGSGLIFETSFGVFVGLVGALWGGLLGTLVSGLSVWPSVALILGPFVGLSFGLIIALSASLKYEPINHKLKPDQEVRRSQRSSLRGGLAFGLVVAMSVTLFGGLEGVLTFGTSFGLGSGLFVGLFVGLSIGLVSALFAGLFYGGFFLIQHYMRLCVLNYYGLLPFKLISFLDQAIELIFLQRVGGSYRFIHRSMQEYFAVRCSVTSSDARTYLAQGTSYAALDNHQRAIEDFDQAVQLKPDNAFAFRSRGKSYAVLGNHQKAIENFTQAIKLRPDAAFFFYYRGESYAALGNHQQAIKDFDQAIELMPEAAFILHSRGESYAALSNHQQAIEDFDQAIKLIPDAAVIFYDRGTSYVALEDYERAIEDFDQAIQLKPKFGGAFLFRGWAYKALGELEAAISDYEKILELEPTEELRDEIERKIEVLRSLTLSMRGQEDKI